MSSHKNVKGNLHYTVNKMAGFSAALWVGIALLTLLSVQCDEDIVSMIDRMDGLNEDIIRVQERVVQQIDSAKIALRLELKQHISEYVRDAIEEIHQGDFAEGIMRSKIITEMKQLKRENHQMKRQLNHMLVSLKKGQDEMKTIQEAVKKYQTDTNVIKECSKHFLDSEILQSVLEQCKTNNETNSQLRVQKDRREKVNLPTMPGVTSSTTSTWLTTPLTVTPKPGEERSRIIIAPVWYPKRYQFRQLSIHSNTVTTYNLQRLKHVTSLGYVSKLRKLLIGLRFPNNIISSTLDSNISRIIRRKVRTYGMAVDEERETIFLTTTKPGDTISKMTTHGNNFTTIVNFSDYYGILYTISINSDEEKIYVSDGRKLFTMMYDGRDFRTLVRGRDMFALTLDITGRFLYYNNDKTLMKLSLSQNVSETVTTLGVIPFNLIYYRDTVYFSTYGSKIIGSVDVGNGNELQALETVKRWNVQTICLVP